MLFLQLLCFENDPSFMGGVPPAGSAHDPYSISDPFFFHTLAHSFALFCTHAKLNSFLFLRFRTLREKLTGVGYPSK